MNFELSEDQITLQQNLKKFCSKELVELSKEIENKDFPVPLSMCKRIADLGYLGVNLPKKYGGGGLKNIDAVIVLEEFAKISSAVAFPVFESTFGPALAINHYGSKKLCEKLLPKICSGDIIIAISMSEPEAGSALTDLKTNVIKNNKKYFLNGSKRWCSGAGHADYYLVYCNFGTERSAKSIGAVVVHKEQKGVSFGKKENHMGFRGIPSRDIFFDNVEVDPEDIVIGDGGFKKLMQAFDLERCGNTTMSIALSQSSFDYVLEYVKERKQFGKPIMEFQAVQLHLAEMKMKLEASRLLLYRAVSNSDNRLPSLVNSSIAKCYANETSREITSKSLQLMGAYGYSKSYPLEQKMRDSWGWGIAGGTIDIQKINIASSILGKRFNQRK